ncbi:MAG: hypothetical protein EG822_18435 [Deltaproteobacteria bacterium]|nr:hypothetical protein [Deltaproteobacteria bacterium]TLN00671.1 MAG: hypothetical protein FDZ73_18700 [bacterium]
MRFSRFSKSSDPLGRYYTDSMVGALLVNSMGLACPGTVLDLGAGEGALVGEASKIWKSSRFITVDIDANAGSALLPKLKGSIITHHTTDALDFALAERLGLGQGGVDAAICNPPYLRPRWEKHFAAILEEAGLSHVLPHISEVPSDLLFIAQNFRLLCNGGRLGLILPDGIVSGEKFTSFRKTLINKHRIERVIELPRRIFRNTDAKAHIVVVSKHGKASDQITIQRIEQNGLLSPQLKLPAHFAEKRLDYSYHVQTTSCIKLNQRKIADVALSVSRGSFSSSNRNNVDFPVFHTTDFSLCEDSAPPAFRLSHENNETTTEVVASPGDILVARVGRNLSQKVCMVRSGRVAISDCIWLLRVVPEHREAILAYLRSAKGRNALEAACHGVGAKFITKSALLEITF